MTWSPSSTRSCGSCASHSTDGSARRWSVISRRTPSSRTGRSRSTRSSSETAASASTPGSLLGAGRVRLRVTVKNGRYRTLIPTRAAGRPSRSMSATTRERQRAHRLPRRPAQSSRSSWNVSSRPCARGTHGVASTGLVSAPRPRRWYHGPIVGPSRSASSRASESRQLRRRCRCRARRASCAVLRADPPQRVGRPLPHHLEPVVAGQLPGAARLAEVGGDLGPQLVVADPDRAVQPGRAPARRP